MSDDVKRPLNVVLYWHMHQPEYRDLRSNIFHQPWTYLHTIKDYVDMAWHLEQNPGARAVVNFAPILLEQINDYSLQLDDYFMRGSALRDPLLSALADPVLSPDHNVRLQLMQACIKANRERLVEPYHIFKSLVETAEDNIENPERLIYLSEQYFFDLLAWYHLSWMAESIKREDSRIKSLLKKGKQFTLHDRHIMVQVIHENMKTVIARYKKLAESGRIELSMTPYAHPIVPLLIDFNSASEAMPEADLPLSKEYPGGVERSTWHMQKGLETFQRYFEINPAGCWPSEGSISDETVALMSRAGVKWLASGDTVLRNSLQASSIEPDRCLHQPYRLNENEVSCFFRDDGLSDLIGFKYSDWHADDAVANLVGHLETIVESCNEQDNAIVSIILDGENAWEYYPNNGFYFLSALYQKLSEHEQIQLTTYSEYLAKQPEHSQLEHIVAGSWVYGSFSTWIGDKDKNRAWDMLVEAKQVYDKVIKQGGIPDSKLKQIELQLATCESSDWFWWFGEYNSAESVAAFDEQFRLHLGNLYQLLNVEPPEYLSHAFSFGSGDPVMGGAMLPGREH